VSTPLHVALVQARGAAAQQAALDAWLQACDARSGAADRGQCAVVVEGPSFALQVPDGLPVERLAAGCVCCVGQVPLRVALTRSARSMDATRPRAILLLVTNDAHLPRLRAQIERGELGQGITVDARA
jgi:hypothetical protein